MENRDKILAKIKKCLALAKSSNPNEAAIALKQAQALMAEYNINQSDVVFSDVSETHSNGQSTFKRAKWDHYLVHIISCAFGCKALVDCEYKNHKAYSTIVFVGIGASSELAAYTYNVLKRQVLKAREHYSKTALKRIVRKNKVARADQFCLGWVHAVKKQVQDFANPEHEELLKKYIEAKHSEVEEAKVIDRQVKRGDASTDRFLGVLAAQDVHLHHGVKGNSNQVLEHKA